MLGRILGAVIGAIAMANISGCAVAHQTVLPDGNQGISINCSGSAMSWNYCYEKAGKKCPHGYDIVNKDGDGGNAIGGGNAGFWAAGSANTRSMLIECKKLP